MYVIAPDGSFYGEVLGTHQEILEQIPEGYQTTDVPPPRKTDYWNGTDWIDIGPAPAWYFMYDYGAKQWVDNRDLEQTKKQKWEEIKLKRNALELSGFVYDGNVYDSDMLSQMRITSAVLLGESTLWTLQNNEVIELTAEQMQELSLALSLYVKGLHERSIAARKLILSCTTVDQVDAVNF